MLEREFRTGMPGLLALSAMLAGLRLSLRSRQLRWALKYNFNPAQPRAPRGLPEGGQWTDGGAGAAPSSQKPHGVVPRRSDDGNHVARRIPFKDSELVQIARRLQGPRADNQAEGKPVRVAQSGRGPRGSGPRRTGGGNRIVEPTLAEEAELAATRLMLDVALQRVRAVDPRWRPTPSLTETVRGKIISNAAQTREAEARFYELQRNGIGPGPFAGESIPARNPSRSFTRGEREEINRIGRATGCHTCGARESGLPS
jgi:hypothetical protein